MRDAEDYHQKRIYRWQNPPYYQEYQRYPRYGTSGSGSDSSNSSFNPRFLGRGSKRKTRRGRRKQSSGVGGTDPISGMTNNLVINISSINLSPPQLSVLQKGLSFSPSSPLDSFLLEQEFSFFRTIRLKGTL